MRRDLHGPLVSLVSLTLTLASTALTAVTSSRQPSTDGDQHAKAADTPCQRLDLERPAGWPAPVEIQR